MPIKTYLLSPSLTYHPNTSITLGSIIADPSEPAKPLSCLPRSALLPPHTTTHLDFSVRLTSTTSTSLHGSVFAKFLELAEARLGGGRSNDVLESYTIERLETVYFTKQPTDEEAAERVKKEEKVRAVVNSGVLGKRNVYMITGLKVARGLKVVTGRGEGWDVSGGFGAPVVAAAGVEVGAEGGVERRREVEVEYEVGEGQDVVFAYQLHVIKHKGWRGRYVDVGVYKPEAAFLNEDEEGGGGDGHQVEVVPADEGEVRGFDEEMSVSVFTVKEAEESCVCVSFDQE